MTASSAPNSAQDENFQRALIEVTRLVKNFHHGYDYSEPEIRKDFIDKFWIALGWDVNHEKQTNPYEQEVRVERGRQIEGRSRRADYDFLAPNFRDVRFFVEAKRPRLGLDNAQDCFQVIRYGWNSHVPLSVLTDFENFRVLDCRYRPDIDTAQHRIVSDLTFHYTQYSDAAGFAKIYYLFGRQLRLGHLRSTRKRFPSRKAKRLCGAYFLPVACRASMKRSWRS